MKNTVAKVTICLIGLLMAFEIHALTVQEQVEASPAVKEAIEELVIANHILYDQGAVDGYGHISVRNPINSNTFFLARSVAPSMVKTDDIMEFDLNGNALNGDMRVPYGERFIHSGIYKLRPDVNSVVHGHAAQILPFGLTGTPLKPVYHMSAFLNEGAPVFEIRKYAVPDPNTDMFVSNVALGQGLAESLDGNNFVILRGHGYAATADSIRKVVFRSIYAIQNAMIQTEAMKMGSPIYLSKEESRKSQITIEKTINRPWELWVQQVQKSSH